jgi:hypothetical protein
LDNQIEKDRLYFERLFILPICEAYPLGLPATRYLLHKSEGKSPFIYPRQRLTPDNSASLTRRDRSVELLHSSIEEMIIPQESDEGKTILSLWEQHQDFAHQYQDDTAQLIEDVPF